MRVERSFSVGWRHLPTIGSASSPFVFKKMDKLLSELERWFLPSVVAQTQYRVFTFNHKMKQHHQHHRHQPVGVLKNACDALCSSDTGLPLDTWSIFCLGLSWFCPSGWAEAATGSGSEQLNLTVKGFCAHAGNVQLSWNSSLFGCFGLWSLAPPRSSAKTKFLHYD